MNPEGAAAERAGRVGHEQDGNHGEDRERSHRGPTCAILGNVASSDHAELSDNLSDSVVTRGPVTSAVVALPNGNGSDFVFGMHSQTNDPGVVGYYSAQANFSPTAKGGIIHAAIQKGTGGGGSDFSAFLFLCLAGTASTGLAYMLGLDSSATPRLVLRKGQLANGIPAVAPNSQGVLRRSAATYSIGQWLHVRLDAILQPTGDVVLQVFANDIAANGITSPAWESVDGLADFTDDNLGANSSALGITGADALPLTSGRVGFGMRTADVNRNAFFARVRPERQTLP